MIKKNPKKLTLEEINKILEEEYGIDLTRVDDTKEILTKLIQIKSKKDLTSDLILGKLEQKDREYIRKMGESSNLINRIHERIIRKLERKQNKIKKTTYLSETTKKYLTKKLEYEIEEIKKLKNKNEEAINETAKMIPLLTRNDKENAILKIIAGRIKDEDLKEEEAEQKINIKNMLDNLINNKGE